MAKLVSPDPIEQFDTATNHPVEPRRAATLEDVARQVGVSAVTVSNVLNGKRRNSPYREAIDAAVRELDFKPNRHARSLSRGRTSDTIDIFLSGLEMGVATLKVKYLQELLVQRGYSVPIHSSGHMTEDLDGERTNLQVRAMNDLRRQRPLAMVCSTTGTMPEVLGEVEAYCREGGIAVCFDYDVDMGCDNVVFDREQSTYMATRHLLELGHRDIGFFRSEGPPHFRLQGFRRAMDEFGGRYLPQWLFGEKPDEGHFKPQGYADLGIRMVEEFLQLKQRPSAMVISDDLRAAIFINRVQKQGIRVPDELSVVSEDGIEAFTAACPVPLTTVAQPMEAIVHHIVDMLDSRLSGEYSGPPRRVVLNAAIIVRESAIPLEGRK